jgi:iron-sulfur cluster repair protein YtfE (RIC family)
MKRHKSLVPLSHDHHQGLVLARRLREADAATAAELAGRLLEVWKAELQPHFQEEEAILLPALARQTGVDQPEIARTLLDHVELRRRVDDAARAMDAGTAPDAELLRELGQKLHDHIRFEEDALFPLMQDRLDEDELARIAARMHPRPWS